MMPQPVKRIRRYSSAALCYTICIKKVERGQGPRGGRFDRGDEEESRAGMTYGVDLNTVEYGEAVQ